MFKSKKPSHVQKKTIILTSPVESPPNVTQDHPKEQRGEPDSILKRKLEEPTTEEPITVRPVATQEVRRRTNLIGGEDSRQQRATSSQKSRRTSTNLQEKKCIFVSYNYRVEEDIGKLKTAGEDLDPISSRFVSQNQMAKILDNRLFISNSKRFMSSPVPPGREYTLVLQRQSDEEYKVYFDQQQEVLSCTQHRKLFLLESSEGPLAVLKELTKNVYSLEPEDLLEERYLICYERLSQRSKYYLNSSVYRKRQCHSDEKGTPSSIDAMLVTNQQEKCYQTRSPAVTKQQDQKKRRLELPMPSKPNMPNSVLRPSQFHCVLEDSQGKESCVMIEHCGFHVIWVAQGLSPLLAIACGLSRINLTENFTRKKHCLLS